ncbi:MAG: hypothetical protein KA275_07030, partial [Chitinophagaceae bacterium]|nr:hypothetical protein [Chitinophagaceae bacterium]
MKKILLSFLIFLGFFTNLNAQRVCGTVEHQHAIEQQDPTIISNRWAIEQHYNNYIANPSKQNRAVITIPVVVHVVYNTAAQNISDAQIASQINVMNADFRKLNADTSLIPAAFKPLLADCEIQFCMAQRDPSGNATTGITRTSTATTAFTTNDNIKRSINGGKDAWPRDSYLNLWVGNISGGILGYAQFPGGTASTDGVVCNYSAFGTMGTASAPFNKGRTATHEVGHWLNLNHIWGDDGTSCSGTDNVGDTPNQADENYGCPSFPTISCTNGPNGDMFMNYMDYTDDACMFMFSAGQKARMQAVLANGGSRVSLSTSLGCVAPNPLACGNPSGLSTSGITTTGATLSWTAVANATSYTLRYKLSSAVTYTTLSVVGTSQLLSGLTAASIYNWDVRANCANGSGAVVAGANFTTLSNGGGACTDNFETNETRNTAKAITPGTLITAKIGTSTDKDWFRFSNSSATRNIKVDLTNLPLDYDMKLYRGSTLVGTSQLGGTSAEQLKYNNGTITTYYANVYGYGGVFNNAACYNLLVSLSATAWKGSNGFDDVEVEENINFEKIQNDIDFSVYPNPSNGNINLDILNLTGNEKAEIIITDM